MAANQVNEPGAQPIPDSPQEQNQQGTDQQQHTESQAAGLNESPLDPVAALQDRLEALEAQNQELQDQILRAKAEAENVRRRAQEDVVKARKFGIESFAESLVPVRDSLEAALALVDQDAAAWQQGVEATLRQLTQAFERNQLLDIAPVPGDKFDPHMHQAISTVPAEQPANTVVQTLQKGYKIADRVLRPALVTVAS